MLILAFIICVAFFIAGCVLSSVSVEVDILGDLISALSILAAIAIAVVGIHSLFKLGELRVIDDKIAMYEEENSRIEEQIAAVVEQYQKYETEIFTEVAPESSMTLVALYPELKSDTLVQSQIDIYVKNNEKIKSLREQKINEKVYRWRLYFGGK